MVGEIRVVEADRREVMKNLERSVQGLSLRKKAKDWWLQAFQLNRCYMPHWDEIKEVFDFYDVDLNRNGPILTIQTLKQVRAAKELTEELKKNPKIRKMAKSNIFPTRSVYSGDFNSEKLIDGVIFVILLRVISEFCIKDGYKSLKKYLTNGNGENYLLKIFEAKGTIIETEEEIEKVISKMVSESKS